MILKTLLCSCDFTIMFPSYQNFWGPLYKHFLTYIPAWVSNYIHYKVWNEITYPFTNFNGATVEVWEWINDFILYFPGHVITDPRGYS